MTTKVGIIMGSRSDYPQMIDAVSILKELGVETEVKIVSSHRTPDLMYEYAKTARSRGLEVVIAGAGGAAGLPGMVAALTTLPVIGVPVPTKNLEGIDSLLSIVQMPPGVPVATVGIGAARNAGILAARILSIKYKDIQEKLEAFMQSQTKKVMEQKLDEASV